jgi:surface protein
MMKKLYLLFILAFAGMATQAEKVTEQEALQKALHFFGKTTSAQAGKRVPRQAPDLTLANSSDGYYVFNDKANCSYVVISGDERMPDVLAYSYDGLYDADSIPCNMKAWLEEYAAQASYLQSHPEARASERAAVERQNINPLLTCWYDQDYPYNNKSPLVNGKHGYTGCVATSTAQVLYYYQWPKQTTAEIPGYTTNTLRIKMPALPITTIDWDNMLNEYPWGETFSEKQIDAIATLMILCGTSIEMDYTPKSSNAGGPSSALQLYFGYNEEIDDITRNEFSTEEWEQILYEELESGRPVLYGGGNEKGGGHGFVIDGYKDGYFHANWGWGGTESWVLMTDAEGWYGYFYNQGATIGIHPSSPEYTCEYSVLDHGKLTLYYDKEMFNRTGTILKRKEWKDHADEIIECVIDPSFANLRHKNLVAFFEGLNKLKSIEGIEYLNTTTTRNMAYMFNKCSELVNLDVSNFKTDNVTNMWAMFSDCSSLTQLDVSKFNTEKVKEMGYMFNGCSKLKSLDVSGFNTSRTETMVAMFDDCSGLESLDVSGFKTDNVTNMWAMFSGCSSLTQLDVSSFDTKKVTTMAYMFQGCPYLSTIYASEKWNMANADDTYCMFQDCNSIIGGSGTIYDENYITGTYARIDEGPSNPGYMTYKSPKYFITYLVDGEEYKSYGFYSGEPLTPEPDPVKEGYFFSGWSDIPSTMPAGDITVTGIFTISKYKLTYMVDGKEYKSYKITYDTKITPEAEPKKEGYTFSGWSEIPTTMPGRDVTVTGTFTANKYKMVYKVDGEEYKTFEMECDAKITPEPEPAKEGYTFSGWSEIPTTMPAKNVTVKGTFTINKYKLILMVDGEEYKTYEYKYGARIIPKAAPVKEGYTFSGWSKMPLTMPAYDVIVTGTFTLDEADGVIGHYVKSADSRIYDLNGNRVHHAKKGVSILRNGNRRTIKVVTK